MVVASPVVKLELRSAVICWNLAKLNFQKVRNSLGGVLCGVGLVLVAQGERAGQRRCLR